MRAALVYPLAGVAGCFAVWAWWRGASGLWLLPGIASLVLFGWPLAQVDTAIAARACAADVGVYIAASLLWMWPTRGSDRPPGIWQARACA